MIFSENRFPPPDHVRGKLFPDHALQREAERIAGEIGIASALPQRFPAHRGGRKRAALLNAALPAARVPRRRFQL
jgi:hypothetical protein